MVWELTITVSRKITGVEACRLAPVLNGTRQSVSALPVHAHQRIGGERHDLPYAGQARDDGEE